MVQNKVLVPILCLTSLVIISGCGGAGTDPASSTSSSLSSQGTSSTSSNGSVSSSSSSNSVSSSSSSSSSAVSSTSSISSTLYTVGGSVSGLSGSVTLLNNGGDPKIITSNTSFTFSTALASGAAYSVTVGTQPTGQLCSINGGTGTLANANVTNVSVSCVNRYTLSINVSGLGSGKSFSIVNNGLNPKAVSANGAQSWLVGNAGSPVNVTFSAYPVGQQCFLSNSTGALNANIILDISCSDVTYTLGGTVSGLSGSVTLLNNGGDPKIITSNTSFTFSTALASGAAYSVTVGTQPNGQKCTVTDGSGTMTTSNVANVGISCLATTYKIDYLISGLGAGKQLTQELVGAWGIVSSIGNANGQYYWSNLTTGASYQLRISVQPTGQTCTVINPSGVVTNADITNIEIKCTDIVYALVTPAKLDSTPAIGAPSYPVVVTDYGVGTVSSAAANVTGNGLYSVQDGFTSSSFQIYPTTHITSEVINSWSGGWTGLGATISIIDDFNTIITSIGRLSPTIRRTATYEPSYAYLKGKVFGTYDLMYSWSEELTHGDLVSRIAGGNANPLQTTVTGVGANENSVSLISCTTIIAYVQEFCPATFYSSYVTTSFPYYRSILTLNYKRVAGIAKQALVVNNNVNLSSSQDAIKTVADIQGHLLNSAYLGVINLSLGAEIPTSGKTFDQVMSQVESFPLSSINSVITVAAGNGGAPCATQDLNGCNALAVALAYQGATAASTIVVGALSGVGSGENIADYSTRAGVLAQRFVLASGEADNNVTGTSFAAPRVAGIAAILKHKYPSLTSSQIANVILLSASKDINNDGFDDFSGVSPIYGHGKASLARALELAGAL